MDHTRDKTTKQAVPWLTGDRRTGIPLKKIAAHFPFGRLFAASRALSNLARSDEMERGKEETR